MSLSSPRALADFADLLPIQSVQFAPQIYQQVDGQASGDFLVQDQADPLWGATIQLDWLKIPDARRLGAIVNSLRPPAEFYLYDPAALYPANDSAGTILVGHNIQIGEIGDDNSSIGLTGAPAGFVFAAGDRFHCDFGDDRRGYFEFAEDGEADGAGIVAPLAVTTPIWVGVDVGAALTFLRPSCKMMLVPGQLKNLTYQKATATGMSLQAIQKL